MDRALLLLLWLRLQGGVRRISRNLLTIRGIVMAAFVLFAMGACLFSFLVGPNPNPVSVDPKNVRRYGTLGLLAFCLMNLLFSMFERATYFPPAEVNFLFTGPFSRRGLLTYKIASNFARHFFSALFMTLVFRQYWTWFVAAYLGIVFTLMFLQLFGMVAALVVTKIGAKAFNRQRKLFLLLLAALTLGSLLPLGRQLLTASPGELLAQVEQSPVIQIALSPLRWFVEAFISQRLWPDLIQWLALASAENAGLLLLVFYLLDARYLEVAAAFSERFFARIQLMRSGMGAIVPRRSGRVRLSLPSLPWWGGVGPIAWRQLTTASRNWGRLILLAFFFACMMSSLVVGAKATDEAVPIAPGFVALIMSMTIFLTPAVPFDFRGDVDRMDILKSLPIRGFWLATGQLIAPVVLVTLIQWGVLALVQIVTGRVEPFLLGAAAVVLPFNFLLFALENLLFLLFPTRLMPWTPGDFQMIGRHMLLFLGRILCLGLALGSAGLVGVLVYLAAGRSWPPALIAAWLVLAAYAIGMIPLVALAFRKFDVSRDTPP